MNVLVQIPTMLRFLTNDEKHVKTVGSNVMEVIDQIDSRYPGLKGHLVTDGKLNRFVNIYVNDIDIRFSGALASPVRDGDTLTILPAVAGG